MTLNCSYNYRLGYPFTTWGEQLFIMVQLDILILLVVHFNDLDNSNVSGIPCRRASTHATLETWEPKLVGRNPTHPSH